VLSIISKLKELPDNKKRVLANFFSLSFLQAANYLLPLVTLPYLVRVLGAEKFGLVSFAQAFIQYFALLTDYGFNLSATREISIYREDSQKISKIFCSVILIKFILMILSFVVLYLIVFSFGRFKNDWQIYFLTFGMVVGQVLFPVWFFLGMEKMKYITFLNIVAKIVFTVLIFLSIKNVSDYIYVPLVNSLGFIIAGILGLWIVFKNFGVNFKLPAIEDIKHQFTSGWHIFISTIAISLYTASNTFILGLFTNNTFVGYYAAGDKIVRMAQSFQMPLAQACYPYISKLSFDSIVQGLKFIRKSLPIIGFSTFLLSTGLWVAAPSIVNLVLGKEFTESISVVRIQGYIPFIVGLSTVYANFFLLGFGYTKTWYRIMLTAGTVGLVGGVVFVYFFQMKHIGMSINALLTEVIVLVLSYSAYARIRNCLEKKGTIQECR